MELSYKFEPLFELLDDNLLETKYKKIRYVFMIGGRGGAKSFALSVFLNQASYKEGWGILFTRWTMSSAEKSVIPEFKLMADVDHLNNERDFSFKRTQVINNASDVVTDFAGLKPSSNQSTGALKSISKKNVFVLEEGEDCYNFELFDKVDNSIRTIKHKNLVIVCLNQGNKNHWIYIKFIAPYLAGERDDILYIETTYKDNVKYLNDSFIEKAERLKLVNLAKYNHIYGTAWQTDTVGALWKQSLISAYRISKDDYETDIARTITDIVVAYDPSVSDCEKNEKERQESKERDPDEDGIIIIAKDRRDHIYVIDDRSDRGLRSDISRILVGAYKDHKANLIVVETNNGGDWIPTLIRTVDHRVKCEKVHATKNKKIRAQPVQAAYEDGKVHHVGHYPELEMEMTTWVYDTGMASPNRLDALVWGITFLIDEERKTSIINAYSRRRK